MELFIAAKKDQLMQMLTPVLLAYLIGSIPSALWISRIFFKMDIREHGSKNMGASNTFRLLGPVYGVLVLLLDMGKGWVAVQLADQVESSGEWFMDFSLWQLLLGLIAVVGHIFPVFAGFRGGKGVATLFGVVLAIQPWTALISVLAFLLVVLMTRYISLGSLTGIIVFMACVWFAWQDQNLYLRWFSLISAVLVVLLHRSNILRLLKGTENKIQWGNKRRKPH